MKLNTKSCSIYVVILCLMGSHIDPPAIAQSKVDCSRTGSTVEHKGCANRTFDAVDNNLNKVYKRIYSKLSLVEKKKLTKAQLNLIKFRDDNCEFEVESSRGGTGYGIFLTECQIRMTEARTKELKNWQEGKN